MRKKVTKTATEDGKANKLTVSAAVISQITEAAGSSDVDITLKAVDSSNKTKFTVKVNAKNLKAGKKLYAYVLTPRPASIRWSMTRHTPFRKKEM